MNTSHLKNNSLVSKFYKNIVSDFMHASPTIMTSFVRLLHPRKEIVPCLKSPILIGFLSRRPLSNPTRLLVVCGALYMG
jgi:hypothetical protein